MTKKKSLAAAAERFYVIEQMTMVEIDQLLNVHEKTIQNWKDEFNWDEKRNQFIQTKKSFHEEMYNFARKLMNTIEYDIDSGNKVEQGRLYTFAKMLPFITKIKEYEDSKDKHNDEQTKDITPDFIKMIDTYRNSLENIIMESYSSDK